MKILVCGARGMLGRDLVPLLAAENEVWERDIEDLDITDPARVKQEINSLRPEIVINAAAYTNVDGCESNPATAYAVNADGAGNIACGCAQNGAKMIHISTDYVFEGISQVPYREEDLPNPLSIYGKSKLQGEYRVQENLKNYLILRTEWLYGKHGKNFVDTILGLAARQKELRIVDDQKGSPTGTVDLSWAIQKLLPQKISGILHVTNSGSCTWFEFAQQILQRRKIDNIRVIPISSAELGRPAPRPGNSVLSCHRLEQAIGQKMRPWEEALQEYLA